MGKYFLRKKPHREVRNRFLIVCEGKTESNYFEKFPINKDIIIIDIDGAGCNTDSLVKKAMELKEKAEREKTPYNQVWCVFDRDSFPAGNFNRAIDLARNNDIKVAYSNEAFELWYILHFEFFHSAWHRERYKDKLKDLLGHSYEKNSASMYDELKGKQNQAISFAQKLLDRYSIDDPPEQNNPSTTVHRLVEEINRFLR